MAVSDALVAGLGAGASGAALLGAGSTLRHRWRARRQKDDLRRGLQRLLRLDHRISIVSRHLDARLAEGVGWAGIDLWPERLTGGLNYLDGTADDAERAGAHLRSIDEADASVGRLRDDMEELCRLLVGASDRYKDGTLATYRDHEGAPLPMSASGRETTPTLLPDDVAEHREDRDRLTWLFRSCLFRTDENSAERYRCQWLVARRETARLEQCIVPRAEPSPIDWAGDLPSRD